MQWPGFKSDLQPFAFPCFLPTFLSHRHCCAVQRRQKYPQNTLYKSLDEKKHFCWKTFEYWCIFSLLCGSIIPLPVNKNISKATLVRTVGVQSPRNCESESYRNAIAIKNLWCPSLKWQESSTDAIRQKCQLWWLTQSVSADASSAAHVAVFLSRGEKKRSHFAFCTFVCHYPNVQQASGPQRHSGSMCHCTFIIYHI